MSEVKYSAPSRPGEFSARVYLVNGAPDGDGDIIAAGAVKDGHPVRVSYSEHDTLLDPRLEPVGYATLHHIGKAVHAVGELSDSPDGRRLREKLTENGPATQWSIGWQKSSVVSRAPTNAELATWPDAKRVILKWNPLEVSPVSQGSCGPTCRTLGVKSCGCGCPGEQAPEIPPARLRAINLEATRLFERFKARTPRLDVLQHQYAKMLNNIGPTDEQRREASRWVYAVCNRLGMPLAKVRWEVLDLKTAGSFRPSQPDSIYLNPTLPLSAIGETVTHELVHRFRHHYGMPNTEAHVQRDVRDLLEVA